jgi:hypothetical protein
MQKPEFQKALGTDWDKLPKVIIDHYDIPGEYNRLHISGVMEEVTLKPILKLAMPVLKLLGALVAESGKNIPTDLINYADGEKPEMKWERTFHFPNHDRTFFTKMVADGEGQIIEYVRFGLGIRLKVWVEDGALHYHQKSYVINVFNLFRLPFPNWLGLGTGWIKEKPALEEGKFTIDFGIDHPLLGRVFAYNGTFEIASRA